MIISNCIQGWITSIYLAGSALSDGQWHLVELNSRRGRLTLAVDKEEGENAQGGSSFPVAAESHLFFGGKRTQTVISVQQSKRIKHQTTVEDEAIHRIHVAE